MKSQTERVWNEWRKNNDKAKKLSAQDEIEIAMRHVYHRLALHSLLILKLMNNY